MGTTYAKIHLINENSAMTIIKKFQHLASLFLCVPCQLVSLARCRWLCWPLTNNRSNREEELHMYRSFPVSHYAASFPDSIPHISTETHRNCETARQTDVVQQRVCVMSAASKGTLRVLK